MMVKHSNKRIEFNELGDYIQQPVWDEKDRGWRVLIGYKAEECANFKNEKFIERFVSFSDVGDCDFCYINWDDVELYPVLDYEDGSLYKGGNGCQ